MDTTIVMLSLYIATQLRFEFHVPDSYDTLNIRFFHVFVVLYIGVNILTGTYSTLWRYASVREIVLFSFNTGCVGVLTLLLNYFFRIGFSSAILLTTCLLIILFAGLARVTAHSVRTRYIDRKRRAESDDNADDGELRTVLIVGAGEAASYLITQARRSPMTLGKPVALVDDAPDKQGLSVKGVPVLGTVDDVAKIARKMHVHDIIIAMPSARKARIAEIVAACNTTRCRVRILSDPERVCDNGIDNAHLAIREPNIADFLSREEVKLDTKNISAYIQDKVVLVTGGGGSIGSELCRQLMPFSPKQLIIFDIYENCAYELLCELQSLYGRDCRVEVIIGSIRDRARLDDVMETYRPNVVLHAAAHKHVPLMEYSPSEAVKNNVFGTLNLLESASSHGVERFVQLSTDKAVNPTNVMGATKRITEMLVSYYASITQMKCMAVRFGNVLGSHGSVIPLFERQIKSGGPVTITDPNIERYFMTIPEAAQLVLQAGSMAMAGSIFVLDMGKPVKIIDLAKQLIQYHGLVPDVTMQIKIIGLRPGEKLYEELMMRSEEESLQKTDHDKIFIVSAHTITSNECIAMLEKLKESLKNGNDAVIRALHEVVPTYHEA